MGDTFALTVLHGTLWSGTHAHDCSDIGGFPESNPRFYAVTLGQGLTNGDPVHFYPSTSGSSSVPGSRNNARAFATDGQHLWVGGGWGSWNGVKQQNLVRLSPPPPSDVPRKSTPTATVSSTGAVTLSWTASSDRDDHELTYEVLRNDGRTVIGSVSGRSSFWQRPTMTFVDGDLEPGDSAYYKLRISDGEGSVTSFKSNTVTAPEQAEDYVSAVLADEPSSYWRLDESLGSSEVRDASGWGRHGRVSGLVFLGQTGALSTQPNGAALLLGGTMINRQPLDPPSAYSMELWFRGNTNDGGRLIGHGSSSSGTSGSYDRHVYMTNSGQLIFGVYAGSTVTIKSPASYNDGHWHHLVATQDGAGMRLYVDGAQVASNGETRGQSYTAYLRVGADSLSGWPEKPSSNGFGGIVDEVAYYQHALTPQQVAMHHGLR
jgi:hypothetical protein